MHTEQPNTSCTPPCPLYAHRRARTRMTHAHAHKHMFTIRADLHAHMHRLTHTGTCTGMTQAHAYAHLHTIAHTYIHTHSQYGNTPPPHPQAYPRTHHRPVPQLHAQHRLLQQAQARQAQCRVCGFELVWVTAPVGEEGGQDAMVTWVQRAPCILGRHVHAHGGGWIGSVSAGRSAHCVCMRVGAYAVHMVCACPCPPACVHMVCVRCEPPSVCATYCVHLSVSVFLNNHTLCCAHAQV